ncbi:hypothetical protein J2Y38_004111 [Flavobacterium sp. 2755]|uniref:hypothetical protein n=1 Tax=Flavobacterium sp. 2755 TaxID=2817765 RepID=UPI0028632598|nr:hypothetical protein [Flavobacterium sp. 2755]MDR6763887.1 hypothetical protein [Flavobacterium sp. 2755]
MNIKEKILDFKTIILQKYWTDPVWSKVISAIIIGIGTTIYLLVKSIYNKVPFSYVTQQLLSYLQSGTEINNFIVWISLLVIFWSSITFIKPFVTKLNKGKKEVNLKEIINELPKIQEHSTVFFSYRIASAFPGLRGLKWYDSKTSVERLEIFFQDPINFEPNTNTEYVTDPLWWFRGHSAMFIKNFQKLSKTKILLGVEELEISRIAVFASESYYKCFIYVEVKGEKPIGLYSQTKEDLQSQMDYRGYSREEYALLGKRPISREDYDDGATIVNGKVIEAFGAKLRVRYLSKYNFLLSAKESPYNSRKFEMESKNYFEKILKGEITAETFFDYLETYSKNEQ